MSKQKQESPPQTVHEQKAPELEERAWPPFAADLVREMFARQRRELDEVIDKIAAACDVKPDGGWQPDVERARFVRAAVTQEDA